MTKKTTKMRGMRLSEATYKAVVQAAKVRSYDSPSAFMRAAVEKELRGADATLDESEQRIIASLERYSKQIRRVSTGQQALFAFVDALVKTLLTCLAEPPKDVYDQAVARGKLRYDRFLKSVGAGMIGDSHVAMKELGNRGEER